MSRNYNPQFEQLGNILVKEGSITEDQLAEGLREQQRVGKKIGDMLVELEYVQEDDVMTALGLQTGHEVLTDNDLMTIEPDLLKKVPESFAIQHNLIPYRQRGSVVQVALNDPEDVVATDNLKRFFGTNIEIYLIGVTAVKSAIERHYKSIRRTGEVDEVLSGLSFFTEDDDTGEQVDMRIADQDVEDAPIVRLVNMMLTEAIQNRATDIHIEALDNTLSVRYRIDGALQEVMTPPLASHIGIISRIKILARLNIAERRLPQDGRFTVKLPGREIDVRTSIMPTVKGEKAVLRLLDKSSFRLDLTNLGFDEDMLKTFRKWIYRPYGIIIVSGPTGSGKSTTLYASLNEIKSVEDNIITVEDPVEYQIDRINQVQIKSDIGLTFSSVLRSVLRQDPDKLLIGEIRDHETADIAIKFSLTGHLVFTTLHANDGPSTITRLLDIGIPHFLVASSLNLVMAQRLVRTICPDCRESYIPTEQEWKLVGFSPDEHKETQLYRGKGCVQCRNTSYKGRTGIFEILEILAPVRRLIYNKATQDDIRDKAKENGMLTLRESGIRKMLAGRTSLREVVKITTDD